MATDIRTNRVIYLEKKLSRIKKFIDVLKNVECNTCKKPIDRYKQYEFILYNSENNKSIIKRFYKEYLIVKKYEIYVDNKNINSILLISDPSNTQFHIYQRNYFLLLHLIAFQNISKDLIAWYSGLFRKLYLENPSQVLNIITKFNSKDFRYISNPYIKLKSDDDIKKHLSKIFDFENGKLTKNILDIVSKNDLVLTEIDNVIIKQFKWPIDKITIKKQNVDLFNLDSSINKEDLPDPHFIFEFFNTFYQEQKSSAIECNSCFAKKELKKAEKVAIKPVDNS